MGRTAAALALAVALVTLFGCTVAKISGKGPVPIILNQPQAKVEVIQNLDVSKMRAFDYTGSYDVSEIISENLFGSDADAIINCRVVIKITPGDYLLNLVTLGLAQSRTVHIKGQVVRAPDGLGSLLEGADVLTMADLENCSGTTESVVLLR